MVVVVTAASGNLSERRAALAGRSGWAGLVHNRRVFAIAVFASFGGLLYGYNQGVFSSVLAMSSFRTRMGSAVSNPQTKGWLVAILELGAWLGVLLTGPIADRFSRKYTIVGAVVVFSIGVVVQTAAFQPASIYAGRFITGIGVGSLSMVVPLYNAELSPAEVRGSLVALQQLAITFGIMISFWADYGANFIGGTGDGQTEVAWRLPLALQLIPAITLGVGILFMPFSPRWLINQGRDEEALTVLSNARRLPRENELVQIEYLEIKAQHLFDVEVSREQFPDFQDGGWSSSLRLGIHGYLNLLSNRSLLLRVVIAGAVMFFQQWTGVNAILYYAPTIFQQLGMTGNTTSLLATGVVGIAMFLATIPAVIWIDRLGRKPVLISGAFVMAACHIIIAILTALYFDSWSSHVVAGWVACGLVWLFAIAFGFSWGPCSWIILAEVFPLSARGKGMSVGGSSNWVTPTMLSTIGYKTFIVFGIFSFLGGLFIIYYVPETSGKTLEEMDVVFGDTAHTGAADLVRLGRIHRAIGLDAYHDRNYHRRYEKEEKEG
ncbi:general substrate transporter [Gautieria morchelliformis]|nr:general substrate transporter [Gautieria morchelliformis]